MALKSVVSEARVHCNRPCFYGVDPPMADSLPKTVVGDLGPNGGDGSGPADRRRAVVGQLQPVIRLFAMTFERRGLPDVRYSPLSQSGLIGVTSSSTCSVADMA